MCFKNVEREYPFPITDIPPRPTYHIQSLAKIWYSDNSWLITLVESVEQFPDCSALHNHKYLTPYECVCISWYMWPSNKEISYNIIILKKKENMRTYWSLMLVCSSLIWSFNRVTTTCFGKSFLHADITSLLCWHISPRGESISGFSPMTSVRGAAWFDMRSGSIIEPLLQRFLSCQCSKTSIIEPLAEGVVPYSRTSNI